MKNTPSKHQNPMRFTALVLLICLTLASIGTFLFLKSHVNNQALAVVNLQARHIKSQIQSSVEPEAEALTRLAILWETNESINNAVFAEHAKVYLQHQENIQAISFIDVSNTVQWVIPEILKARLEGVQEIIGQTHSLNTQAHSSQNPFL